MMKKLISLMMACLVLALPLSGLSETYESGLFSSGFPLVEGMTVDERQVEDNYYVMTIQNGNSKPTYHRVMMRTDAFTGVDIATADPQTIAGMRATLDVTFGDVGYSTEVDTEAGIGTFVRLRSEDGIGMILIRAWNDILMADMIFSNSGQALTGEELAAYDTFLKSIVNG